MQGLMKSWVYQVLGLIALAAVAVLLAFAPKPARPGAGFAALDAKVRQVLEDNGDGLEAGIWVGGPAGPPWYEWEASTPRPAASAVKTALLIEFFARHSADLDRRLPELTKMLDDEHHPAVAMFWPGEKWDVRWTFQGSTVRRLGEVMMGSRPEANHVYNAAANVIIADLGGLESATQKIHARDPDFAGIEIGRYMLAEREPRDNEATAAALAAVLRRLATRGVPGVDDRTQEAMCQAVLTDEDPLVGTIHSKGGDLYTDPLTVVRSGWCDSQRGTIVFVVMTAQPNPGSFSRAMACARQREATDCLTRRVLETAWRERGRQ
jgi:hypothetical protein